VTDPFSIRNALDLLDWKRRIFDVYREIRESNDPPMAWQRWRAVRDELFATHLQSPVPADRRASFTGLPFFDYDPAARVLAEVTPAEPESYDIATSGEPGGSYRFTRIATVDGTIGEDRFALEAYWLEGYGGGLFLPFRDATAGRETYGAGRYLFDTVKGADLGTTPDGRLVLDFNFAYNPSCAYDPAWVCPLAPPPNRLRIAIRAGERYISEEG
jgi:uncharacterized protein (DUF1684 family)